MVTEPTKTKGGTTAPWTGRRAGGGGRIAQLAKRIRNAMAKIARNPVTALRVLLPRYGPFAAKAPDAEFRRAIRWSFGELKRESLNAIFPGIEHIDVRVVRSYDREPLLSMTPSEVLAIGAMVRVLKPERILEIGTFEGNTTVNLAANAPSSARVFTLDLPPDWGRRYELDVRRHPLRNDAPGRPTSGRQFIAIRIAFRTGFTQLRGDSAQPSIGISTCPLRLHPDRRMPLVRVRCVSDTHNALRVIRTGGSHRVARLRHAG